MNTLKLEKEQNLQKEHLVSLYTMMLNNGDRENANKILDLYEKTDQNELIITFAGHFSAGKSSMINALMGEDILPKSPIPTSANVVKITSGGGYARVHLYNDEILEFKEPYDMDRIKEYSKDKDTIKRIEISTRKKILPDSCSLMDTPGIDAADDADRIMTESSLHLVDLLFYVMDYNHVQSEVNLQFLQQVHHKGIPFYVIINQIDKHDEYELSFNQFKGAINHTFDQWNIHPEEIFYSSLLDKEVNHNQFDQIQKTLHEIMDGKFERTTDKSIHQVVDEHKKYLKNTYENKLDENIDEQTLTESLDEIESIQTKLKTLNDEMNSFEERYQKELQNTLNNAYIMPAVLRDKAQEFLESQQSDFKVGFFGAKKKTAMVKEARLHAFLTPLQENIEASIQWKLREKFAEVLKEYRFDDEAIKQQVQSIKLIYEEKDLIQLINSGAKVNGDYVLNYTRDVVNDIKTKFRQRANEVLNQINNVMDSTNQRKETELLDRLSQLEEMQNYHMKKEEIESEYHGLLEKINSVLEDPTPSDTDWDRIYTAKNKRRQNIKEVDTPEPLETVENKVVPSEHIQQDKQDRKYASVKEVIRSIDKTIETVSRLPGFHELQKDLEEKNKTLSNRSYTIALFGAFSAGKSSFANALIGEKALPVSPNPTTATVNRICPVTDEYDHGTVLVSLKDEEALVIDIVNITKKFSPKASSLEHLLEWIKKEKIFKSNQLNKMYQSYLVALLNGYESMKNQIGDKQTITLNDFEAYVTDESKACYIESINLYYDCDLTKQGITLVDTPGADSVNARHTNVAFEYIKHADAILYVTYYNHALSRADRDFLMQLGRVKEAFQLDKMFFIVNAADLAQSEEELALVVQYVESQLLELGIRLPRLYPVSSKQSLVEKRNKDQLNEQMATFEDNFYQFIHYDLTSLTVDSALWDMRRAYNKLTDFINSLNLDEEAKEKRRNELQSKQIQLKERLVNTDTSIREDQIRDKMEKQLYYVLERLEIRFHDMFKEHFNPTTVTESGRKAMTQLKNNLESLVDYVGFELFQELQAVSLRMEAFIVEQGHEFYGSTQKQCLKVDHLFDLPNWKETELQTPEYQKAFTNVELSVFDKALSSFKGTKAFFEKNEKEQMKEAIFEKLAPLAKEYIEENNEVMKNEYISQWKNLAEEMKEFAIVTSEKQVRNYEDMMKTALNPAELEGKKKRIQHELHKHGIEEVS